MNPKQHQTDEKAEAYRIYIRTSAVGLEVVLSIVVGGGLGWLIDEKFPIAPWGVIAGFAIGALAAGRRLWIFSKAYIKEHGAGNGH